MTDHRKDQIAAQISKKPNINLYRLSFKTTPVADAVPSKKNQLNFEAEDVMRYNCRRLHATCEMKMQSYQKNPKK